MTDQKVEKLGNLIRQARKEQGLTQKQLSATANVGERFIRELEQGKESCHLGKSLKIIAMLGIELHINGNQL